MFDLLRWLNLLFYQAEDGIRCAHDWLEFRRVLFRSLGDILSELIQNARRGGASAVDLKVIEADEAAFLAIVDDGAGIEDPSVILALGRSGWGDDIARREDPAGMGDRKSTRLNSSH